MNLHKYNKYKSKYLLLKGGNNQKFAEYLATFMKKHHVNNTDYAIIAGYAVGQITGRVVTDLDVIVNKKAYAILSNITDNKNLHESTTAISNTKKVQLDTEFGEIEFFERENTGFPSDAFSLTNLHKNDMLSYDKFGNPYLNEMATIEHYANIKKDGDKYILGDYNVNKERVEKNINHLTAIYNVNKKKTDDLAKKIEFLKELL